MAVILLRHGVSTSNLARTLAGRSPGIPLAERGYAQARALAERLAEQPIVELVSSPLLRCKQTLAPLAERLGRTPVLDDRIAEVDYGEWTGRELRELVTEPLWKVVQRHASGAVFPGGEGLANVQTRAVLAIREHENRLRAEHGHEVLWVACSHGDVIKSVLADAFGMHLDAFQRIVVEPASLSVVRYTATSPYVWRVNDTVDGLPGIVPDKRAEAVPGGEVTTPRDGDNGTDTTSQQR